MFLNDCWYFALSTTFSPVGEIMYFTMRTNLLNWCNLVSFSSVLCLFGGKDLLIFSWFCEHLLNISWSNVFGKFILIVLAIVKMSAIVLKYHAFDLFFHISSEKTLILFYRCVIFWAKIGCKQIFNWKKKYIQGLWLRLMI